MEHTIEYEHLQDKLIRDEITKRHFNEVKNTANKYKLKLSNEDFERFFNLQKSNKDIDWLMHAMSEYGYSLIDALVAYIAY
jgi:hypothetical protein